jgi:hypothetical protein
VIIQLLQEEPRKIHSRPIVFYVNIFNLLPCLGCVDLNRYDAGTQVQGECVLCRSQLCYIV